jgi:hypothetical protein
MSIQYKNKKTGGVYLLETACHVKINDNWVEGIAYFNVNKLREMFVTTKEDFFNSFEEIIDEVDL